MKITNVSLSVLESDQAVRDFELIKLHGQERERWLHSSGVGPQRSTDSSRQHEFVLHVDTDEGITGHCTACLLYKSPSPRDATLSRIAYCA